MRLCTLVLNYTEQNLMTVNNLSIVLGPSILYELDCDEFSMVYISHAELTCIGPKYSESQPSCRGYGNKL